tara:strand:+ start:4763 stop:5890 length:1128 start_codon:yes stop_codon:yes gene_type:complete
MAITFTKQLSEDILLNAYTNNIVEFSSNNISTAFKCVITVDGESYEITPNLGQFYFNFKTIFKNLITDYFEDAPDVELDSGDATTFVKDMSQVYLDVQIDYAVSFVNGETETSQRNISLLQAVSNFQDRKLREIQDTDSFAVLGKLEPLSNRLFNMVYFEGYPFDIQVYKKTPGNVTITNKTNLLDYTFNLPYKVNRIFFSDTKTDTSIQDILPLVEGRNELEFDTGALTTIMLEKKSGLCGVYLKWKNHFGGWSYWLFNERAQTERDIKDLGYINNDYQNLDNNNFIKNIGKVSQDTMQIGAINVEPRYREFILSLFDSPKVYLFMGAEFSKDGESDWLSVKLNTDSIIVTPFKDRPMDINCEIELPLRNTLTL